jgi:RimJ/RimL family protein N-acetyltransferase
VPLTPGHEQEVEALIQDEDVRTYTRVPTEPPADFAATWINRYIEGWREGSRAGFAIETHEGEFVGLGMFVRLENEAQQGEIGYVTARRRGAGASRPERSDC